MPGPTSESCKGPCDVELTCVWCGYKFLGHECDQKEELWAHAVECDEHPAKMLSERCGQLHAQALEMRRQRDEWRGEAERAWDALERYGEHKSTCAYGHLGRSCTCGLDKALAALDRNTTTDPVRALVNQQAEDEGLWFVAATAPEAYLQQELRKLHAAIEGKSPEECGRETLDDIHSTTVESTPQDTADG